jgi:hypothetical protein
LRSSDFFQGSLFVRKMCISKRRRKRHPIGTYSLHVENNRIDRLVRSDSASQTSLSRVAFFYLSLLGEVPAVSHWNGPRDIRRIIVEFATSVDDHQCALVQIERSVVRRIVERGTFFAIREDGKVRLVFRSFENGKRVNNEKKRKTSCLSYPDLMHSALKTASASFSDFIPLAIAFITASCARDEI